MAQRGGHSRWADGDRGRVGELANVERGRRERIGAGVTAGSGTRRAALVRAGSLTAAVALTLAACTATATRVPSPPSTPGTVHSSGPTTTPSPTPTPLAPPQRPAAMDRDDAEGAIAAATYFISLYPYVYASGDLLAWNSMSDPACIFCASVSDNVDEMVSRGDRLTGGTVSWLAEPTHTAHENSLSEVHLVASQSMSTEIDQSGVQVSTSSASEADIVVLLTYADERWRIRGVDLAIRG